MRGHKKMHVRLQQGRKDLTSYWSRSGSSNAESLAIGARRACSYSQMYSEAQAGRMVPWARLWASDEADAACWTGVAVLAALPVIRPNCSAPPITPPLSSCRACGGTCKYIRDIDRCLQVLILIAFCESRAWQIRRLFLSFWPAVAEASVHMCLEKGEADNHSS